MSSQTIESKNMGNAKNIYWNDKRNAYIVYLQRYGQAFYRLSYSLEDAIELRDKVLEFFKQHKRKPSSEELGLERKKPVFAKPVEKRVAKPSVKCKTCTKEIKYARDQHRELFHDRGNLCGYCYRIHESDREVLENSDSMKHISFDKSTSLYVVQIKRFNQSFSHRTKTLEEAKYLRHQLIEFYVKNNRLPDSEERSLLLSINSRVRLEFASESRSNTNEKYISLKEDGYYSITISRNCRFYRSAAKTLERAIELRDNALEYFDRFGILPTAKQLTEYIN